MSNQRIATTNERLLQLSGHVGAALKPLALGWSMNGRRTVRSELDRCTVWRIVYQSACKHPSKKMHTTILSWNVFDVNGQHLIRCHKSAPPPPSIFLGISVTHLWPPLGKIGIQVSAWTVRAFETLLYLASLAYHEKPVLGNASKIHTSSCSWHYLVTV